MLAARVSVLLPSRHHALLDLRALAEQFGAVPFLFSGRLTDAWIAATGSAAFTMLLDAGDRAKTHMLSAMEKVLRARNQVDLLYADEEHDGMSSVRPVFKPGW